MIIFKDAQDKSVISVSNVLNYASRMVAELSDVFDYVDPCFPREIKLFVHFTSALAQEVGRLFDVLEESTYCVCGLL